MNTLDKKIAIKIACIDALIFFALWSGIATATTIHTARALLAMIIFILPAAVIVGWRGYVFVWLILEGNASLRKTIKEGVIWGTGLFFLFFIIYASPAYAAGGGIYESSPLELEFWLGTVWVLFLALCIGGFSGAIHGAVFFYLNRWLVSKLVT